MALSISSPASSVTVTAMAKFASYCLFLLLVALSSSGGTLVGVSFDATELGNVSPSLVSRFRISTADDHETLMSLANATSVPVDLLVGDKSVVEGLMVSRSAAISWLKSHVVALSPQLNTKSVTLDGSRVELCNVLPALESLCSATQSLHLDNRLNVSVQFPLSFLKNLSRNQVHQVNSVLRFLRSRKSFVSVEASADVEPPKAGMTANDFIEIMTGKASLATSILLCNDVPIVMTFRSRASPQQVSEFADKVWKHVADRAQNLSGVSEVYVQVSSMDDFGEDRQMPPMPSSRRELVNEVKKSVDDPVSPPMTGYPAAPTIVTVPNPATNPVTLNPSTPTNPAATPVPIPSNAVPATNPAVTPITNPVATPTTPVVTNPVTTPVVTNPVTTYPVPPAGGGSVPVVATPPPVFTSPVVAPPATNAPAIPGQSWCVARAGASETALQSALDYACGLGGADCSQIQVGAGCYNPNTLENHASYAFNSYYQRNPVASSCDFGGTAIIVNINPSTGSCVYATYSSNSPSVQTPSTPTTNPATTTSTGTPATGASSSYGTPPSVLNTSTNPASGTTTQVYGSQTPPLTSSTSASKSAALQPFTGSIILAMLFVIKATILGL